jgi:phage shock protein PspC (stress-responsive transcriptional regulator)
MKKNITINMFGRLYAIDEDAYQLLQQYIDTLRNYFSRKPDGKEIADDIEARIAELFDELKASGVEAINIQHVQEIITRIGNPQQMDDGEPEETSEASGEAAASAFTAAPQGLWDRILDYFERLRQSNKRLYRDPSDKKFTGMLAGCAHYFGGDPLWWRLGFVVLFFLFASIGSAIDDSMHDALFGPLSGTLLVLYIAMSILTPMAQKPEDRLKMKGREVTPQNLAQEVTDEHIQADRPRQPLQGAEGCLTGFFKIMGLCFKVLFTLFGIAVGLLLFAGATILVLLMTSPDIFGDARFTQLYTSSVDPALTAVCLAGTLGVLLIGVYCAIHSVLSSRDKVEPMGTAQRLVWAGLWVASLAAAIVSLVVICARFSQAEDRLSEKEDQAWVKANTHNGVFIDPTDWEYLSRGGWQVIDPVEGRNRFTDNGSHYTGEVDMRYLNGNADTGLSYQVERRQPDVAPGTYTLTVAARTNGMGAYVYAIADGKQYLAEIPVNGDQGGNIWQEAKQHLAARDTMANSANRQYYEGIANANEGKGYGWSRVTISGIKVTRGTVSYGVSTRSSFTNTTFSGQWVSATDFNLK